jgi:hypothetical protein
MAAGSLLRLDLGLPRRLQLETAKLERPRARGSLVLLVQAKLRELLQLANLRTWARLRVKASSRVKTVDPPSPMLRRAGWRPPLLGPQVLQQDCRLRLATGIPRVRVRARQYLRGPGPFAFSREISDDQKCNRAAHCGDCPISAQCHRRCNRRGLAGYGNRRSRLLRKRARRVGTFPIVGADKCPCPLRRIQD